MGFCSDSRKASAILTTNTELKNIYWNDDLADTQHNQSFVDLPKGSINNNQALDQIMAWRRTGDKPLSEPMVV